MIENLHFKDSFELTTALSVLVTSNYIVQDAERNTICWMYNKPTLTKVRNLATKKVTVIVAARDGKIQKYSVQLDKADAPDGQSGGGGNSSGADDGCSSKCGKEVCEKCGNKTCVR